MARSKTVNEYIAAQPRAAQGILRRVRTIIRKAVPGGKDVIAYQIPAYRTDRGIVLYFAAWKHHYSLYPVTRRLQEAFKDALSPYEKSKGTIRFPLSDPVPVGLIKRIAKFRAKEVAQRTKKQGAARKPRRRTASS